MCFCSFVSVFFVYVFFVSLCVFRTVGDGHLGQVLPPVWELLTRGLVHHQRTALLVDDGDEGADNDSDEGGVWGFEYHITKYYLCHTPRTWCHVHEI